MSKHAPGPWEWEYHPNHRDKVIALCASEVLAGAESYRRKDVDVLLCSGDDEHSFGLVNEANARLIAAAPDLHAACKKVEPAIRTLMDELGKGPATNWGIVNDCLCDTARALAKAEGRKVD